MLTGIKSILTNKFWLGVVVRSKIQVNVEIYHVGHFKSGRNPKDPQQDAPITFITIHHELSM